jgi:hypothetical protein
LWGAPARRAARAAAPRGGERDMFRLVAACGWHIHTLNIAQHVKYSAPNFRGLQVVVNLKMLLILPQLCPLWQVQISNSNLPLLKDLELLI